MRIPNLKVVALRIKCRIRKLSKQKALSLTHWVFKFHPKTMLIAFS